MKTDHVDLLLLNCTNLEWRPIFPYAFVQVSEVASRYGLSVKRQDLLYVENWEARIRDLIKSHNPSCIGLHIRQIDTLDINDYLSITEHNAHYRSFYPLESARIIIGIIRRYSNSPIILGGFGFTAHASNIANYLEVDLGVRGCPDGFIGRFNDVLTGRDLSTVPGLIYHDGEYQSNPIENASPTDGLEYNPTIISEIGKFYGPTLTGNNPPTIAVEVARGCPFSCYFCTEPDVKGRSVRRRNLDTVEAELEQLLEHGLHRFWFICSELNIGGASFVLELAEIVNDLKKKKRLPIEWSGYSLPTLNRDEMEYLKASGYAGAMNDLLSLDDKNLRKARVPYKKAQAIEFLLHMSDNCSSAEKSADEAKYTANSPSQFSDVISMFLGNSYTDRDTLSNTLDEIEYHGLSSKYNQGHIIPSTRIFPIGRTKHLINELSTVSIGKKGRTDTDTNLPTFHFPQYLMDELKDEESVLMFFQFVADTYLSKAYLKELSVTNFVVATISLMEFRNNSIVNILENVMSAVYGASPAVTKNLRSSYHDTSDEDLLNSSSLMMLMLDPYVKYASALEKPKDHAVDKYLSGIFEEHIRAVKTIQGLVGAKLFNGIEVTVSPYAFSKEVFQTYGSVNELREYVDKQDKVDLGDIGVLYLEYILFITRTKTADRYRSLITTFTKNKQISNEYA